MKGNNGSRLCGRVYRAFFRIHHIAGILLHSAKTSASFVPVTMYSTQTRLSSQFASQSSSGDVIVASDKLDVYHARRMVDSTQDEMKRLLDSNPDKEALALIADSQSKGRGTGGRTWHASDGNLYLTCAIATEMVPLSKMTLLPIGVGVIVAELLSEYSNTRPVVKWPNDVLIGGRKVAGTLVENHRIEGKGWWLVGIGVNIESYPGRLPPEKGDRVKVPRAATCLRENAKTEAALPTSLEIGIKLACDVRDLCADFQDGKESSSLAVTDRWKLWAEIGSTYEVRETGENSS